MMSVAEYCATYGPSNMYYPGRLKRKLVVIISRKYLSIHLFRSGLDGGQC